MKKILLGTTGLVGALLIASAASAETPKVTLGGFSDFQAGFVGQSNNPANNRFASTAGTKNQDYGFRNANQINVKIDGKTDSGLGYGAEIDLLADITNQADNQGTNAARTFTYLESKWGRVELGGNKSAAATMRVDASSIAVATGGINGAWTYFVTGTPTTGTGGTGFITTSKLPTEHGSTYAWGDETTNNATKISYYTPSWQGLQLGVSYTPNAGDRGQTMNRLDGGTGSGLSDVFDVGLGYSRTFMSAWKFNAAATYEHASGDNAALSTTTLYGTDDVNAYNVGASLAYQSFSIAGSYGNWDDAGMKPSTRRVGGDYWTAGLGYAAGPVGLSATYINSELDESVVASRSNDFNNVVLGAEYKLAPGLTPYAEVSFFDFNGGATTHYNNNGGAVVLGTQLAF